jgi:hypothetical protein
VSVLGNERPAPPDELTEEEAEEWRAIASRMPHDWFTRENHPLLCEYCRHIVSRTCRVAHFVFAACTSLTGERLA